MSKGVFGLLGAVRAGNITEHMVGRATVSIYELGKNRLVVITDSKSISSWSDWNTTDGDEVNIPRESGKTIPKGTTYQTYIFVLSSKELQDAYEKYDTENGPD